MSNFLDWFFIIAIMFVVGVTVFISYIVVTEVQDTGIFDDNSDAKGAIDTSQNTIHSFDGIMLFIIIGLSLFVLVSSALITNHPAFLIVGLILLFIAITVAGVVSNAFWDFSNTSAMITTANAFPKTTWLMDHLPIYVAIMGIAATIAGYGGYQNT